MEPWKFAASAAGTANGEFHRRADVVSAWVSPLRSHRVSLEARLARHCVSAWRRGEWQRPRKGRVAGTSRTRQGQPRLPLCRRVAAELGPPLLLGDDDGRCGPPRQHRRPSTRRRSPPHLPHRGLDGRLRHLVHCRCLPRRLRSHCPHLWRRQSRHYGGPIARHADLGVAWRQRRGDPGRGVGSHGQGPSRRPTGGQRPAHQIHPTGARSRS
mmetsp:Transcript_40177/g.86967  ORF Transcript_40177/g.86967 Transcript_40177/m.86967 type:complete len:212 (-) Transcript_40177:173-808(-)